MEKTDRQGKRLRIVLATEYFPVSDNAETTGGVEAVCFHLVKELSSRHEIIVLCTRQPRQPVEGTVFGARVIRCGPVVPYSAKGNILRRFLASATMYLKGRRLQSADVVHAMSFLTYPFVYLLGRRLKARTMATWHETWIGEWIKNKGLVTGSFGEVWERLSKSLRWDSVTTVSDFTRQRLLSHGLNCRSVTVIPNGIDLSKTKSVTEKKHARPTLVVLGRLTPQKDVGTVLKAFSLILNKLPDARLHIVGGGPCLDELKILASELGIGKSTTFFGFAPTQEDYWRLAKRCHIMVSASLLEGFGIAVLDALSLGLPVVLSDIGSFIEVTQGGKGGLLFRQKDYKDLAEKALKLLQDKKLYAAKAAEAALVTKSHDWKSIARKYAQIWRGNSD